MLRRKTKKPTSRTHLCSAILRRQLFLHPGTPSTHLLFVSLQMEWHKASYLLLKLMLVFPMIFFSFLKLTRLANCLVVLIGHNISLFLVIATAFCPRPVYSVEIQIFIQ